MYARYLLVPESVQRSGCMRRRPGDSVRMARVVSVDGIGRQGSFDVVDRDRERFEPFSLGGFDQCLYRVPASHVLAERKKTVLPAEQVVVD